MDLFNLQIPMSHGSQTEYLYNDLKLILDKLAPGATQLDQREESPYTIIRCQSTSWSGLPADTIHTLYRHTAHIVADFIINEFEEKWLRHFIHKEYPVNKWDDVQAIENICRQALYNLDSSAVAYRKRKIAEACYRYLEVDPTIIVEGFIRFRLRPYLEELKEIVHYAIEEFFMNKQYEEFIGMLQYFVHAQEAKISLVNVIHAGDTRFYLLDEQMKPVDGQGQSNQINDGLDHEDLIVSALVTLAPEQIVIHTRNLDMQVIQTIQQIFEGRYMICEYCHHCEHLLELDSVKK